MYTSCAMATSRGYHDGQPPLSPRPSRVRCIPGHLEDYELNYPFQPLHPTITRTVSPTTSIYVAPPNMGGFLPHPVPTYQSYESPDDRLQHLESRWQTMTQQMDNVRLTPHPQGGYTHPTYRSQQYAAYMPQYGSLPYLERIQMSPSPSRMAEDPSASHIPAQMVPLFQDQVTAVASLTHHVPSATQTEAVDQASFVPLADDLDHASDAESTQSASNSQMRCVDSAAPILAATTDQVAPVSWAPPAQSVPPVNMIQSTPTTSLVPPAVSAVPAPPIQTAHAPSRPAYRAPRYWQTPPQPYLAPPVQHYYPQQPFAPVWPPDDHNATSVLEMAIASSFGIPKPKLTVFTSGRGSDFLLLKKGLDSVLGPHRHLSEDYKYQVLLDHLRFPAALQIDKRFINSATPYTTAMQALMQRYGQPRQLVQGELNAILNAPPVKLLKILQHQLEH